MKSIYLILTLLITLYSCGDSTNSQIEKLKQENSKLKNSLDSLEDNMKHSLVIYQDDMRTHIGNLACGLDTIDSKSDFYLSTYLWVVKLPEDYKVKWTIDQKGGEIDNADAITKHLKFKNLKPGNHTFSGTYEIYLHGRKINDNPWEKSVYVKK